MIDTRGMFSSPMIDFLFINFFFWQFCEKIKCLILLEPMWYMNQSGQFDLKSALVKLLTNKWSDAGRRTAENVISPVAWIIPST